MILFSAFMISLVIALICTPLASRIAEKLQLVDKETSTTGIPVIGGVAIFLGFAVSMALGLIIFPHLPGQAVADTAIPWSSLCLLMTGSGALMTLTGFVDDRKVLSPVTKLFLHSAVVVAAGVFFMVKGAQVRLFLEGIGVNWLAAPVTLFWLLGITNSMNLLDHADGVTSGIAAIAALFFAALNYINGNPPVAYISVSIAGASLGFLFYNFPPASIYMGDCGSNFLGFMLGIAAILGVYTPGGEIPWLAVMSPLLILAVPLVDTVMVLLYRRKLGKPLFQGDKNHLTHRLMRMGYSKKTSVLMLYLISIVMGTTALLLPTLRPYQAVLAFINAGGVITVFALFIVHGEKGTGQQ
ncbi:hypothetical protein CSA37_03195 [Candidatus Fermentibacteria bacterium]|nr:MAG: hypothetical protein CSA37_03195 [Candidatus Fermentibacteria bacterium]